MALGIIGGGFGLYGYAVASPWPVVTMNRYATKYADRNLDHSAVAFVETLDEVLSQSKYLCLAIPPKEQDKLIPEVIGRTDHLFLEKPFASTGIVWEENLRLLRESGQQFSINYAFVQTSWWDAVFKETSEATYIIDWGQKRPPESWKLDPYQGGGIARYYAVHFVPALCQGFAIKSSRELSNSLELVLHRDMAEVAIRITLGDSSHFRITKVLAGRELTIAHQLNPFDNSPPETWKGVDPRVENLRKYLASFGRSQNLSDALATEEFGASLIESFGS